MQQNTCAEVSEMQCFVTILVRNDDTFEAIFGNKNRLCATFLPRNKRQMHFFCVETLLTRVKSGVSNLLAMWRAKISSGFEEKFLFTKIEYLRESVPFRDPSSNFPREISSHWHWMHATHILYSLSLSGNIQKVSRVFKVTWYCCSTNELSWGKGCHRGFSHRSYIGIRKDYWLQSWKHKNTREVRLRLFLRNHLSKLKSFVLFSHLESAAILRERFSSFPAGSVRLKITPWKEVNSDIALPVH